ncbi:MAG: helix-turn-helix domain-containing protein [Myxococcota bacterium]|nr:helix-turn-helix domain-containing protein [Myxococcota bacterium]
MDLEDFGRKVRQHRERLGMSLADVGAGAGCSRQNVHKLEKAIGNPTVGTLARVAHALGMELRLVLQESDGQRADLERRMRRLLSVTGEEELLKLEDALARMEAELLPASVVEEERRVRTLAGLLEMAGVPAESAIQRAQSEPDKPETWDAERARLVAIIQEELTAV